MEWSRKRGKHGGRGHNDLMEREEHETKRVREGSTQVNVMKGEARELEKEKKKIQRWNLFNGGEKREEEQEAMQEASKREQNASKVKFQSGRKHT